MLPMTSVSDAAPGSGRLPQLAGRPMVTDGGMETDFIFHHGVDLPLFAGLMLESATWRANPDWGAQLGYSPADLARVNHDAITMLAGLRDGYGLADVVISGMVGPRGDGYRPGEQPAPDEAAGVPAAISFTLETDSRLAGGETLAEAIAAVDAAGDLDEGDIGLLADRHRQLVPARPALAIVGGCCGTDARHVGALWN
jgi:homocysteine S-methyltransferase